MVNIEQKTLHPLEHIALTCVRAFVPYGRRARCTSLSVGEGDMLKVEQPTLHPLEHIALTNVRAYAPYGRHPSSQSDRIVEIRLDK